LIRLTQSLSLYSTLHTVHVVYQCPIHVHSLILRTTNVMHPRPAKTQRYSRYLVSNTSQNTLCLALAVMIDHYQRVVDDPAADLAQVRTANPLTSSATRVSKKKIDLVLDMRIPRLYGIGARYVTSAQVTKRKMLRLLPSRHASLLDQNHGEVRVRIMRCVRGTLGNPALKGGRWRRRK